MIKTLPRMPRPIVGWAGRTGILKEIRWSLTPQGLYPGLGREVYSGQSLPYYVRGHNRRPERFYATVEDELSTLSSHGKEYPTRGFRLCGVRREADVRSLLQESGQVDRIEEFEMRNRFALSSSVLAVVTALGLWAPTFVAAQASSAAAAKAAARTDTKAAANLEKAWTMPRTQDGQPDMQGYWTSLSFTPMERPAKYGGSEV